MTLRRTLLLRGRRPPYPDPEPVHSYPLQPLTIISAIIYPVSRLLANHVYMHGVGTRRAIRPFGAPRYGQRRFHQVLVAVQVAYEGRRHSFEHDGYLFELGDESIPPALKTTSATEKNMKPVVSRCLARGLALCGWSALFVP